MPFCPQCGIDNPASARYCDQCGAVLIPVPAAPAAAPATPAPAAPAASGAPLVSGPIVCSQCGTTAIPGEAFCDNCGAPLTAPARPPAVAPVPPYNAGVPPQPVYPPPQPTVPPPISYQAPQPTPPPTASRGHLPPLPDTFSPQATQPIPMPTPAAPPARAALAPAQLIVVATGAALPLPNAAQAVVGRADTVSNFYPDIDLTPQGALEHGVGRRHLRLFVQGGQIMVEDMDSTNGTLLNGQRLAPRQPQPLRDGDQIQPGKMALRFQL